MNSTQRHTIIASLVSGASSIQEKSASLVDSQTEVLDACMPTPEEAPLHKVAKLLATADTLNSD